MISPEGGGVLFSRNGHPIGNDEKLSLFPRELLKAADINDSERSPALVAKQTAFILDLIGRRVIPDSKLATEYLITHTLPLLGSMGSGSRPINQIPNEMETARQREAYEYAQTVMGEMPALKGLEWGQYFSEKGAFAPPRGRREFVERIDELRNCIVAFANGDINYLHANQSSVMRTLGFFEAAKKLKVKQETNEKEIQECISFLRGQAKRTKVEMLELISDSSVSLIERAHDRITRGVAEDLLSLGIDLSQLGAADVENTAWTSRFYERVNRQKCPPMDEPKSVQRWEQEIEKITEGFESDPEEVDRKKYN